MKILSASHYYVQGNRSVGFAGPDGTPHKLEWKFEGMFLDGTKCKQADLERVAGCPWDQFSSNWRMYCRRNGLWDKDNDAAVTMR